LLWPLGFLLTLEAISKKAFSPDIGVMPSSQILDILEYACGLILGQALISNENPNFEMAYSQQRPIFGDTVAS
jgi:hypothetical protein